MTSISGFLIVDKPLTLSSHDVVGRLRKISGIRRIGHAGTLDPLATGVLLVGVGRATRLLEYLSGQPKTYEATVRLGATTTTYDAEGDVVAERPLPPLSPPDIDAALAQFRGDIWQTPPIYSAIKQAGQPLYKLARQGAEVAIPARPVVVHALELVAWQLPELRLRIVCSAGTYIRSLAHDLGEALGCGGMLAALRRTAVGDFTLATAVPLAALTPENWTDYLQAPATAVRHLPQVVLPPAEVERLLLGQRLARSSQHSLATPVAAFADSGEFIGVLLAQEGYWQPHKMFPPLSAEIVSAKPL